MDVPVAAVLRPNQAQHQLATEIQERREWSKQRQRPLHGADSEERDLGGVLQGQRLGDELPEDDGQRREKDQDGRRGGRRGRCFVHTRMLRAIARYADSLGADAGKKGVA